MVAELDTADGAAWRARYNAPKLAGAKLAVGDPGRGLAISDHEGVTQHDRLDPRCAVLTRCRHRQRIDPPCRPCP